MFLNRQNLTMEMLKLKKFNQKGGGGVTIYKISLQYCLANCKKSP